MRALGFLIIMLFAGCHTHSQCRRDLYQRYYGSAVDAFLTLKSIDQGKIERAHEVAMGTLGLWLSQLHDLGSTIGTEDLERQAFLTHSILTYFIEHQAQLVHDKWSLKTVTRLQKLL